MSVDAVLPLQRTRHPGSSAAKTFTKPGHPSFVSDRQTIVFILYKLAVNKPEHLSVVTATLSYISLPDPEVIEEHTRLARMTGHLV